MRLDLFLSTLLLGITLLTFSVALAHMIGSALLGQSKIQSRARGVFRTVILTSSMTGAMLFFIEPNFLPRISFNKKFWQIFSPPLSANSVAIPRLILDHDETNKRQEEIEYSSTYQQTNASEAENTLFATATSQNISLGENLELQVKTDNQKKKLVLNKDNHVTALCQAWISEFESQHFQVERTENLKKNDGSTKIFFHCISDEKSMLDLPNLELKASSGNNIFLAGVPPRPPSQSENSIFDSAKWVEISKKDKIPKQIKLGGKLSFGEFPAGLILNFGPDWPYQESAVFPMFSKNETNAFVDEPGTKIDETNKVPSPLVMRNTGKGNTVWTALPPRLYGWGQTLYSPALTQLNQRIFSYLSTQLSLGIGHWQFGKSSPVVIGIDTQYSFEPANKLAQELAKRKIPATFFVTNKDAVIQQETIKNWHLLGHQLAGRENDIRKNFLSAREQSAFLKSNNTANYSDVKTFFTRFSEANENTFAALIANKYSMAWGDPFGDRMTPYFMQSQKSDQLKLALAKSKIVPVLENSWKLLIIPSRNSDDRGLQDLVSTQTENFDHYLARLKNELLFYKQWNGVFTWVIHSQVMGDQTHSEHFSQALELFKTSQANIISSDSLYEWSQNRAKIKISYLGNSKIKVQNTGNQKIIGLTLNTVSQGKYSEQNLPEIPGNQSVNINIVLHQAN